MPPRNPTGERFMRMFVDLWLDEEKIRGRGDDGQREGGITLEQEAVYLRLCLTQFRQPDGYLPNRRAFLVDASACANASCSALIDPVLERFFLKTKDGSRLYNPRARNEWLRANSKSLKAKAAAEVKWKRERGALAPRDANADANADADASCKREREREIYTYNPPYPPSTENGEPPNGRPPDPPAGAGGQDPTDRPLDDVERVARVVRSRWSRNGEPIPRANLSRIRHALKSTPADELIEQLERANEIPEWLVVVERARV